MKYIINKIAKMTGLTVRALRYYDQIGLLKPDSIGENSYRYYTEDNLLRLQQILFFRELEFSLEEIKKILDNPEFNIQTALEDQKKLLLIKKTKVTKLINNIDKTMKQIKNKTLTSNSNLFNGFSDDEMDKYKEEAKQRWGQTDAYKQSQEKVKRMSKEELNRIGEEGKQITIELSKVMDKPVSDESVQSLIQKHHDWIENFYDLPKEMYINIGKMYVTDPRFTAYYDKVKPGLAQFVCDAIEYFCQK